MACKENLAVEDADLIMLRFTKLRNELTWKPSSLSIGQLKRRKKDDIKNIMIRKGLETPLFVLFGMIQIVSIFAAYNTFYGSYGAIK